jgi:hypothetical protein
MDKYRQAIIDLDREEPHDRPKDLELLNEVIEVLEIIRKYSHTPLSRVINYINNSKKYGWDIKDHNLANYDIYYAQEEFDKVKAWLENV